MVSIPSLAMTTLPSNLIKHGTDPLSIILRKCIFFSGESHEEDVEEGLGNGLSNLSSKALASRLFLFPLLIY